MFDGDDAPTSRHGAGFCDGVAVGCATFHLNQWEAEPAWQLRGMATLPEYRGKGIGRAVLAMIEADLEAQPGETHGGADVGPLLWCNARVPAVEFYRRLGWRVVSGEFEIPTAGPHVKMIKRLTPRRTATGAGPRTGGTSPGW